MIIITVTIMFISRVHSWPFTQVNFNPNWRSLDNGNYLSWENRQPHIEPSNEVTSTEERHQAKLEPEERFNFIFPGTKWCGAGDIADNYDDLGTFVETDKCCRQHDRCPDTILSGETKHNLTNKSYYTRLSCECDDELYTCLHNSKDNASNKVGLMYFNAIGQKCFKDEYPIVKCLKRGGFFKEKCLKYKFDETQSKKYQWFDVPLF